MRGIAFALLTATCLLLAWPPQGQAEQEAPHAACNDAGMFTQGGVFTKVCWPCFFPIKIAGVPTGNPLNVPLGTASSTCVCPGRLFGYPTPGFTVGYWSPTHALELTRQPWCSPTLGTSLFSGSAGGAAAGRLVRQGGYRHKDTGDMAYYNFHLIIFPIGVILDLIGDTFCVSDAGMDIDILYLSEIDPTHTRDELALFTTPEAILFANPVALAACLADAVAATAARPLPLLHWCAGTWGHLYPHSGQIPAQGSIMRDTSLGAARGVAMLHRRMIMWKQMGDSAVCRSHPWPNIVKQGYKFQTVHPLPELLTNHWIGASTFRWGEWRAPIPTQEDAVYLNWTWKDCCVNL